MDNRFGKKHREKRLGDEVDPFTNIFDRKAVSLFLYLLLTNGNPFPTYKVWTKVLGHFGVSGMFSNSHRPNPSPHPHKQSWTRVSRIFSEFQLCIGWGWGRENCKKISKRIFCFIREPRNGRKIWMRHYRLRAVPLFSVVRRAKRETLKWRGLLIVNASSCKYSLNTLS